MHIAVSTVNVKASSKYSIIIICLCLEMLEGIEPTISTMPLGSTNKIVSGDRPSTASSDQTKHTISFSSKYDWIPCGVIATVSNHSLPFLSVNRFDRWSTLATHLPSLCLGVLFSPSDPWNSSHAPSHRQSTFELCVLSLSLSQTTPHQNSVGD